MKRIIVLTFLGLVLTSSVAWAENGKTQQSQADICIALAALLSVDSTKCIETMEARTTNLAAVEEVVEPPKVDYTVHFARGASDFTMESLQRLEFLVQLLQTQKMQKACLKLVGHSDAVGAEEVNLNLSVKRAEAVEAWLIDQYPAMAERIETEGKGEDTPLTGLKPNNPFNRRVEFFARDCLHVAS